MKRYLSFVILLAIIPSHCIVLALGGDSPKSIIIPNDPVPLLEDGYWEYVRFLHDEIEHVIENERHAIAIQAAIEAQARLTGIVRAWEVNHITDRYFEKVLKEYHALCKSADALAGREMQITYAQYKMIELENAVRAKQAQLAREQRDAFIEDSLRSKQHEVNLLAQFDMVQKEEKKLTLEKETLNSEANIFTRDATDVSSRASSFLSNALHFELKAIDTAGDPVQEAITEINMTPEIVKESRGKLWLKKLALPAFGIMLLTFLVFGAIDIVGAMIKDRRLQMEGSGLGSPEALMKEQCVRMDESARQLEGIGEDLFTIDGWNMTLSALAQVHSQAYDQATNIGIQNLSQPIAAGANFYNATSIPSNCETVLVSVPGDHVMDQSCKKDLDKWRTDELLRLIYSQHRTVRHHQQIIHETAFYLMKSSANPEGFSKAYAVIYARLALAMLPGCLPYIKEPQSAINGFRGLAKKHLLRQIRLGIALDLNFAAQLIASKSPLFYSNHAPDTSTPPL